MLSSFKVEKPASPLLRILKSKVPEKRVPCWFMRQAGRYLPEYREIRQNVNSFLELCYSPKLASEVTLQPLRRFPFDAAIIFSDILVIPDALGLQVKFAAGDGPTLQPLQLDKMTLTIDHFKRETLFPVYEAISLTCSSLESSKALIGFSGAPWTLACYMLEGKTSKTYSEAKIQAFRHPERFQELLDLLVSCVTDHLIMQIKAGCDVVQIFDSWASLVPDTHVFAWVIEPMKQIVEGVRKVYPDVPIIGFPKDLGIHIPVYVRETKVDCIGLGFRENLSSVIQSIPSSVVIQGNLDPSILVAGGDVLEKEINHIKETMQDHPHIFNLGHGILPETPIAHVEDALKILRQ